MIAPTTEKMKPAGCPSWYQPMVLPRNPARNDPAIPSRIVMMHPPGSRPGVSSFATIPMTPPMMTVQRSADIFSMLVSTFMSVEA
jgi:hypothetical protein